MPGVKKQKGEDLDFQMSFYEGIVGENPDFVDALVALGEIYTKKGLYAKGLKIDKKLAKIRPESSTIHYNLACSLSLIGDIAGSFKALRRAIDLGYDDFVFMNEDPDLLNLRQDKRFRGLVKKIRKGALDSQNATSK